MTKWEKFFDEKIKEIAKCKVVYDIGGGLDFRKTLLLIKNFSLIVIIKQWILIQNIILIF